MSSQINRDKKIVDIVDDNANFFQDVTTSMQIPDSTELKYDKEQDKFILED